MDRLSNLMMDSLAEARRKAFIVIALMGKRERRKWREAPHSIHSHILQAVGHSLHSVGRERFY